ncbi:hypothetical protein ATO13_22516 [Stappia sp. 22II-S9-Z10]|nr:hypothetical protein ATO13_22516 [Stappia sp. 22II-S9-Z10]
MFDDAGMRQRGDASNGTVWSFNTMTSEVRELLLHGGFVLSHNGRGAPYRPAGPYFATEAEARIALRWAIAQSAAFRLRKAEN